MRRLCMRAIFSAFLILMLLNCSLEQSLYLSFNKTVAYRFAKLFVPKFNKIIDDLKFSNMDMKKGKYSHNIVNIRVSGSPISLNDFYIDDTPEISAENFRINCFSVTFHMKVHYKWLFFNDNFQLEAKFPCNNFVVTRRIFLNKDGKLEGEFNPMLKFRADTAEFIFWGGTPSAVVFTLFKVFFKNALVDAFTNTVKEKLNEMIPNMLNDILLMIPIDNRIKDNFYLNHQFSSVRILKKDVYIIGINCFFYLKDQKNTSVELPGNYSDSFLEKHKTNNVLLSFSDYIFQSGIDLIFDQNLQKADISFDNDYVSANISCKFIKSPQINFDKQIIISAHFECFIVYRNLTNQEITTFILSAGLTQNIEIRFENDTHLFFKFDTNNTLIKDKYYRNMTSFNRPVFEKNLNKIQDDFLVAINDYLKGYKIELPKFKGTSYRDLTSYIEKGYLTIGGDIVI